MAEGSALRLPPDANEDEAAAICAAVEQWLAAEARSAPDEPDTVDPWTGRRFGFSGRLAKVTGEAVRPPDGTPSDPWTAAGRLERR